MTNRPERRFPAHPPPVEKHNKPIVLFVTVNLAAPGITLACDQMHEALREAWKHSDQWRVGWYMIMPDHVHFFCVPGVMYPVGIRMWCKYWKGQMRRTVGLDRTIWQRDCWDTQMRNYDQYVEKRSYVRMNPVRRGLVADPEEWMWQGELNTIRW